MDVVAVGPGEPEETDRNESRTHDRHGQTSLWRSHAVVLLGDSCVSHIIEHGIRYGKHHAHCDTQERQTGLAGAPSLGRLEYDGERREHHVQRTIDDSHINAGKKDDRLPEQKHPRPGEGDLELLRHRVLLLVDIQLRDVDLAGELRQLGGSDPQEDGGVGLRDEEGARDPQDTREDGHQTLDPPPALSLAKEAAHDGSFTNNVSYRKGNGPTCKKPYPAMGPGKGQLRSKPSRNLAPTERTCPQ